MPLFLKHKLCLIHIPRCGGTTFEKALEDLGDPPIYSCSDESVFRHYGQLHSPQHASYLEMVALGLIPADFRVVAFVRDPYERFLSEFAWRADHAQVPEGTSQAGFARLLFHGGAFWDDHERPQTHFLDGGESRIELHRTVDMDIFFQEEFRHAPARHNWTLSGHLSMDDDARAIVAEHWGCDSRLLSC